MLQEYPVESFHHSIWLWAEHHASGLINLQLPAHLWEQIWFILASLVCVQLQRDTIIWNLIFHSDFDYFWGIYRWHWIGLTPFAEVVSHHNCLCAAQEMVCRDPWLFLQMDVPYCTCAVALWLLYRLHIGESDLQHTSCKLAYKITFKVWQSSREH